MPRPLAFLTRLRTRPCSAVLRLALFAATAFLPAVPAWAKPPASGGGAEDPNDDEKVIPFTGAAGEMDYGPFLSYSVYRPHHPVRHGAAPALPSDLTRAPFSPIDFPPGLFSLTAQLAAVPAAGLPTPQPLHGRYNEQIVPKAITIRVAKDTYASFDTELLRYYAGWTGGFLTLAATNLGAVRGAGPAPAEGVECFQTQPAPGWGDPAADAGFADARPYPVGPLPRNVGHYKGLYRHGQKVVLSYTVGSTDVLELPGATPIRNVMAFSRTIRLGPSSTANRVAVCDVAEQVIQSPLAAATLGGKGSGLVVSAGKSTTEIIAVGLPTGATLNAGGGRIFVTLPPLSGPVTFKLLHVSGPNAQLPKPAELLAAVGEIEDVPSLCQGGPPLWKEPVIVPAGPRGDDPAALEPAAKAKADQAAKLDASSAEVAEKVRELRAEANALRHPAYVVDTINLPETNPWNSLIRPTGFDFFPDGRCALCTLNGDVWVGTGLDAGLNPATPHVSWRRFAAGLYEPLGLKIVNNEIYVLGRDQITRLHDLNHSGEADFYENFNNDAPTCAIYHAYAMDLWTDSAGNFYYIRDGNQVPLTIPEHGCLFKISPDGRKSEIIATGLRAANGMAVGPGDEIVCGDNQGHWIPSSKINRITPGGFYGYVGDPRRLSPDEMETVKQREATTHPGGYDPPLCWIPYGWDNSSGGQAWVTGDRWGPLAGHMLHTSYGKCALFEVMEESVDAGNGATVAQGGVVQLPGLKFDSGIMRARMNEADGQLYVCGLRGWRTSAAKGGCFQRVRYTGKPFTFPSGLRAVRHGVRISFTAPLDATAANDAGNYNVEQFVYHWSAEYGSPEFKASDPQAKGHDTLTIRSARVSADGKSVFLTMDGLGPVQQMVITMNVKAADGSPLRCSIGNTIHRLGPDANP